LKINNIIFSLPLPILLGLLWLIKTFINTGCLIFPLPLTCFETTWSNIELTKIILQEITNYGKLYISLFKFDNLMFIFNNNLFKLYIILFTIIFSVLILFIVNLKKYKKILVHTLIFIFIFNFVFIYNLDLLIGFSTLLNSQDISQISLSKKIFFKEIFLILFFIISSFLICLIILLNNSSLGKFNKIKIQYFPFLFSLIFLMIWIFYSPNPRFGIGYLAILPMTFILIFLNCDSKKLNLKSYQASVFVSIYLLFIVNIFVKNSFQVKDFFVKPTKIYEKKQTIKRKQFGVMPVMYCDDFSGSNLCGIEKNCYFIEKDARMDYLKYNYPIINKITDRNHPKCVKK
jgi:hypothetical protein